MIMVCVYYTPADKGGEDTSNTNNKTFSHIVGVGFENRWQNQVKNSQKTDCRNQYKLDFGMGDYKKSPKNAGSLIRKTVAACLNGDVDDKYGISVDIPDELQNITVNANEELFQRMLENLINNSIRHNPDGCEIRIAFAADRTKSNRCVLQISDNGQGAPEETLKALNRKSLNKTGKLSEHGIGLRVVKQIAKFHAWKVSFESHEPQGFSTIVVFKIHERVFVDNTSILM